MPIPVVRDDFNWQNGNHSLTMGGTFKFIKTNSNLINNFNFPGIGLQGAALASGLDRNSPSLRHPTAALTHNVAINDYDSLFATALGVIGDISTNYIYNNKGVAQPAGSGGPQSLPLLPNRGVLRRHLEDEPRSSPSPMACATSSTRCPTKRTAMNRFRYALFNALTGHLHQ